MPEFDLGTRARPAEFDTPDAAWHEALGLGEEDKLLDERGEKRSAVGGLDKNRALYLYLCRYLSEQLGERSSRLAQDPLGRVRLELQL